MRLPLFAFLGAFIVSCNTYDYYTVASPDGSQCITLEYSISIIPEDSVFVKMYLGSPPVNKQEYVRMVWSNIGDVTIDWDSKPIKIRSWLLRENTISPDLAHVQAKMLPLENKEFHMKGSGWKSYDFTWISDGKYKSCN